MRSRNTSRWASRAGGLGLALLCATAACSTDSCDTAACMNIAARLPVNEIAGAGGDFVEFINTGTSDIDVSGYGLTDSDADARPRVASALRFPAGTVVRPGNYLLVMLESDCPTVGMNAACVRGEFGLSQGNGDTLHLIDGENRVVISFAYAANQAPSGRSWGRVPNGSGAFQVTARTPGAANAP